MLLKKYNILFRRLSLKRTQKTAHHNRKLDDFDYIKFQISVKERYIK